MVAPVNPGDILAEKYRVDTILGVGGMGVVVSAEHIELRQKVAVKFMLPAMLDNVEAVERFLREARAAVRLRSEHVARVLDVGRLSNNAPYIIMEFLEGVDLYDLIRKKAPLSAYEAIDILLQACKAMAEAHTLGIIHRDLKPANLFVAKRPDGSLLIKVLDFGISKLVEEQNGVSNTKTSVALGSPAYMSPEQMRSAKHVDNRADIWSLGAILYQLLSNRMPFEAESPPEMFARVLGDEPTPLQEIVPDIDIGLADIIHKCLAKDRDERYASVSQFAKALAPYGDEHAAKLADSVANVENDHREPDAAPSRASTAEPGQDLSPRAMAKTAQTVASKPNTITTRSGSAGPIVAESLDLPEISSNDNKKFVLIGGVIAALVLVLVFTQMSGDKPSTAAGGIDTETPNTALQPLAIDAGVPIAIPEPVPATVLQDAAIPDATVPDAGELKPNTVTSSDRRKKPKSDKPKRPIADKPISDTKKPETPKKPTDNADPFGTMQ